jgi:hypothetical protein
VIAILHIEALQLGGDVGCLVLRPLLPSEPATAAAETAPTGKARAALLGSERAVVVGVKLGEPGAGARLCIGLGHRGIAVRIGRRSTLRLRRNRKAGDERRQNTESRLHLLSPSRPGRHHPCADVVAQAGAPDKGFAGRDLSRGQRRCVKLSRACTPPTSRLPRRRVP